MSSLEKFCLTKQPFVLSSLCMIPLFTSDYSIGRSILKIDGPPDGPDTILDIAKENSLKEVYLVEDSMIGFLESFKIFSSNNIPLRYGVRFKYCNDAKSDNKSDSEYKVIIFALNDDGCKSLYKIYSDAHSMYGGYLDSSILSPYKSDNLIILHPFYNSYIYNNMFYFKNCIHEEVGIKEFYSIEENNLPFDSLIKVNLTGKSVIKCKTILYKNREDADAYQVYRMACNRSFSKSMSLSSPSLDHFASREFCWESYLEANNGIAV